VSNRRVIFLVVFALVALVLASCGGRYDNYTPSAADLTLIAESYTGDDKALVQATALARFAQAESARAESDKAAAQIAALSATKAAADANERQQYIALTAVAADQERAVQATRETQWQWATIEASNATQVAQATAQALSVAATSQAMSIEATAQQRAYEATATADALNRSATATAEARAYEATATAQYKADVATATQQAQEARASATAESHQATRQAAHATMTREAEEREAVLAYGRDYGIPIVLLLLGAGLITFLVYAARQYVRRPVVYQRSVLGDAEPMAVPVQGGGFTFVDLDRQPGPAITILPNGQVTAPLLRPGPVEERVTARDQMVDAMSRPKLGGGHRSGQVSTLPAPPEAPAPGLRSVRVLRRLDQAGRAGFIAPPLLESIEADWEVEQ